MPNVLRHDGSRPYWYIRYRRKVLVGNKEITRKEVWHRLGYCDEITKREAQRLRDEIMRDVNCEVYTIQSHIRFGDFVQIYKEQHIRTLGAGTKAKYLHHLKRHILPAFGALKLSEVDREIVQRFLNTKEKEGLAWWTRSDLKNIVCGIFTKASDWGYWTGRNPTIRATLGRKRLKRERRILTDAQFRLLLSALPELVQLMVETAVSTGMRISEILGMKWGCVDLDRGLVWVRERYYRGDTDEPKSERSRRVLPLGYLVEAYRERRARCPTLSGYVFEKDGEPMDDRALLKDVIRPAAKQLGIYFPGFGWHSFRRQNLTVIQEEGATTFEAQAQAGHSRPIMTGEYTVVHLERRKAAVLRLQERLLGERASSAVN